uniref:Protein TIC 214 n=1 Tax=Melilotus albus TaxID=47082 RepID=A0A411LBK2_MELAB|nr:hypothetical chloroplast RF19 [Melilotus albus]QBE89698.1 hypothetical chloroplast RF19 [Melilotus albus]
MKTRFFMIYQSLIPGYLVALCLKIMNSAVVIGLYYGFLSTFSIGPSYLFLIRAQVMEKDTETKISATTGFITGQLMMFISIYYAPLHLALIRPHTITVLTLTYLFFNFIHKNDKHYYSDYGYKLDSGYKNPNSIRKFSIYKVFFNNLFFQLLNPLLFPSSILIRLMNIYLFRSNNKLLFLTSSFVGWLIGHIFLMKCIGLILLVWSQQKNSIKSKLTMRFDKYILLQLRNYVGQIFVVFSFVILAHYLGRTPLPYFYPDEIFEYDEREKDEINAGTEREIDVEIDSETEETKQEQNRSTEDDLTPYLFSEKDNTFTLDNVEEETNLLEFEKPIVTTLFDYRKWNRPLRYIKNDHFESVVRDENSQFFFHICQSDGKERISFTYPPDLSSFLKMMEKKIDLFRRYKISSNDNELFNSWSSTNKEKTKKLSNEFLKRAKVLDKKYKKYKKFLPVDVLDTRIRLSNDKRKKIYLPKIYDPLLNGPFRGQIFSPSKENITKTPLLNLNKIHGLLLAININSNYPEFEQKEFEQTIFFEEKLDQFDRRFVVTEIGFLFQFMSLFLAKPMPTKYFWLDRLYLGSVYYDKDKTYPEQKKRKKKFLLDAIRTDRNNKTIFNRRKCGAINEISKQVPRWSYNLVDELEQEAERMTKEAQIRCAPIVRSVVFSGETDPLGFFSGINKTNDNEAIPQLDLDHDLVLLNSSREPDYAREIIKGSMRPQRRKTVTSKLFQGNVHSPLFLEVIEDRLLFVGELFEDLSQYWKEIFRKPGTDNSEFLEFQKRMEQKEKAEYKDEAERRLRKIEEDWENILYGLIIRSFVLLIQSVIRKYIVLPSLIITKNIIRILLFQNPEWSEDFRDWRKEVHIKCTYQGFPVSHNKLPKNWFDEGIQIMILSPFVLKPWHTKKKIDPLKKKYRSTEKKNFGFLTGYGTCVDSYLEDHVPIPFSFLGPILKKIQKQLQKDLKNRFFLVLKFLNERQKWFRTLLKEIENWSILKSILFRFQEIDELSDSKKTSTISKNNPKIEVIEESPVKIESINWTISSFTEKRIKDLNVKTKTIIKQIETMTEEKKEGIITSEIDLNSNKTTYDAKRLELQKNSLQILQRRTIRLTRKSYSFFKFFMERVYIDILLWIGSIARIHRQRFLDFLDFLDFLESTNKIVNVNKSVYNKKKNEERIDKTNQSIIPFMSIIDKSWNITNMNSQNSCDVSSLSQAYVLFKLSQIQVSNRYKYKLRSIFESRGRSFFLKNEIKDYFFRIQGIYNSKLRHKNRPDSLMNQWTNWLKVHYQYDLPESRWSRLVPQNWRNRVNKHRVAQKKDYDDSYEKKKKKNMMHIRRILGSYPLFMEKIFVYGKDLVKHIPDPFELQTQEDGSGVDFKPHRSDYYDGSNDDYKYRTDLKGERDFLLQKYLGFYLNCDPSVQETMLEEIKLLCLLVKMKHVKKFFIMSIKKVDLDIENLIDPLTKDFSYTECRDTEELKDNLTFFIEPIRLSTKKYEESFIYQIVSLPLIHKSKKRKILKRNREKSRVDQKITENKDKNHYDLFVPENLLSTRRRRELRILMCFNPRNRNTVHRKTINDNENKINNFSQVLGKNKDLDSETKKLMNFKLFLWPNYRLEDLACINRYWFDTHNGSRFSIFRIHMYPRLKI